MRNQPSSLKDDNFRRRLAETMGSELDPELVTPMSAGFDQGPDHEENFPLVRQFRDTNMGPRRGSRSRNDDSQRGRDQS